MRIERVFLKSKVARRVFLRFVLCAAIPLGSLALFTYARVAEHLSDQADLRLRSECRAVSQNITEYLRILDGDLQGILDMHPTAAREGDGAFRHLSARYESLAVVENASGSVRWLLGEPSTLPALSGHVHERLGEGRVTVVAEADPSRPPRIHFVRALDPAHLLVARVKTDALWNASSEDGGYVVIDLEGALLHSSSAHEIPLSDLVQNVQLSSIAGYFEVAGSVEDVRVTYRDLFLVPEFGLQWTVASAVSEDEILAPLRSFARAILLVTSMAFWVVLLLSHSLIRKTLVPVDLLARATQRIAAGDLGTRVRIDSNDEFEDLGQSFNSMAECVQIRARELERANRVKIDFLANMSHELRTPLTAILGFADLCLESDTSEQDRRTYMQIIGSNGRHLLDVIGDVLDVSKIEAERMTVELSVCPLVELVEEVTALLDGQAREKGLDLRVELPPDLPVAITSDPTRLRQILLNVIGNAIKFTRAGEVCLSVRWLQEVDGGPRVLFEVADTGVGMRPEQVERIFEPFVQGDGSTTRKFGGTGLGLSISRSLARLLGGDLTCTSWPDVGSRFLLTIDPGAPCAVDPSGAEEGPSATDEHEARPLAAGPEEPGSPEQPRYGSGDAQPAEPRAPLPGPERAAEVEASMRLEGRVLLAEDVPVNQRLVTKLLERVGLEVESVEDGAQAYERAMTAHAAGEPYRVVLMDMQMPVLDGYESTRRLRRDGYTAPIFALTSHSMPEESRRCIEAGCDAFASKPIDREALFRLIADTPRRVSTGSD